MEDLGRELLSLRLTGWGSIERGASSITHLGVCSASGCSNRDQYAALPVAAVQLWLMGSAIFDQAAPFKALVILYMEVIVLQTDQALSEILALPTYVQPLHSLPLGI